MHLVRLEITGFKSFAKKTGFDFESSVVSIVGPNGSGKSNVAEAIRFVLGEQSMKSMRGKRGEDMIWNGSQATPRANRASVAITFNNATRFLDIDFDEVVVERIVHRDGANEYRLNGSVVRLKDIVELLASANIGQTGHHIISQGEADKILAAQPRERREMLEDALGLKVYQYKKEESVRKLDKTEENMRQVEALRKEVQPHLRFLKRQVDKLQKTEELRKDALVRFKEYFARESSYIEKTKQKLTLAKQEWEQKLSVLVTKIKEARDVLQQSSDSKETQSIVVLSERSEQVRKERREAAQQSARILGQLDALENIAPEASVSREKIEAFARSQESLFSQGEHSFETLQNFVKNLLQGLRELLRGEQTATSNIDELKQQKVTFDEKERALAQEEQNITKELETIRNALDTARTVEREKERALFTLTADEREARHSLETVESDLSRLRLEEEEYKRELAEAGALIGREATVFSGIDVSEQEREIQIAEKRELQKIKIRLEEMGAAGGAEVLKEYQEVSERDVFLEKELSDLTLSAEGLRQLITDLEAELSMRFNEGMKLINTEFSKFFSLMFDGGSAALVLVKEPVRRIKSLEDNDDNGIPDEMEKTVEGVEISLTIPRKRIKSLVMLSGGERALTSIALIFAMSSVNPPPFLVLDETDAALDEANSRRYGDMISALSEKSQLVLITHNRETMSRAGILYGVTMGNDGVSKVLSVKLEEAVKVAK